MLPDAASGNNPGTRRQASHITVTVQGRYGACFCRHGTNFIEFWRDRGTSFIDGRIFISVDKAGKKHWRSIAVEFVSKAENCHGAECSLCVAVRIRVPGSLLVPVNDSMSCKKRDELITPTIRVTISIFLKLSFGEQFKERIIYIVICCPQFLFCQELVVRKLVQIICCSYP